MFIPFWFLQLLIPRKKNIWLFGSWNGEKYNDNSKYLYEYVKKNQKNIDAYWITKSKKLFFKLNTLDSKIVYAYSLKGILTSLKSKYVFISWGKTDVNHFLTNGAILFNLWHGNPIKKIGLENKNQISKSKTILKIKYLIFPYLNELNYHYYITNSNFFSTIFIKSFNCQLDQIICTGNPRLDAFGISNVHSFNLGLKKKFSNSKLIYYLPTFRDYDKEYSIFNHISYSEHEFIEFLNTNNLVFVSSSHYASKNNKKIKSDRFVNVPDNVDINLLLKDSDILITDYSGAFYDYLNLSKPIILAAFDLVKYKKLRGFCVDYEEISKNIITNNWKDLLLKIEKINEYPIKNLDILIKKFNEHEIGEISKKTYNRIIEKCY